MARGTQHRKRRTGPNARKPGAAAAVAAPRRQRPPQWQEQLFFQRLRVHAKWAFVFLALVFGLGFVFLGIGSGSNGITSALQNAFNFGGSGGASISSLQRKADKHPFDPAAWRDLATAYETRQNTDGAIQALSQYVGLRPKDVDALGELATQYTQRANQYATDYQNAANNAASQTPPAQTFAPAANTPFGKAFNDPHALQDPISAILQQQAQTAEQTALAGYQTAEKSAEQQYRRIVALTPRDPNARYQLGQAAEAANDTKVAIAAYKAVLRLVPGADPLRTAARQRLTALAPPTKK